MRGALSLLVWVPRKSLSQKGYTLLIPKFKLLLRRLAAAQTDAVSRSSQGEQHYGRWSLEGERVCCETLEPREEAIGRLSLLWLTPCLDGTYVDISFDIMVYINTVIQ